MMRKILLCFFLVALLASCSMTRITGTKMDKLELGMSKDQVINILGNGYNIAEKRSENGTEVEVLSYKDHYNQNEFYMFVFSNKKLEKWYRELLPKYEVPK